MRENPVLTIHGEFIRETELAINFRIHKIRGVDITPKSEWFPKSQITKMLCAGPAVIQTTSWLIVSEWIMNQKGLLDIEPIIAITQKEYHEELKEQKSDMHIKNNFDSYDDDIPF